ncbi:MGDG synthase family glycosyltransferase [Niallia sp. Krafla_26]|uniref:MGDG synthase family glycosyltransferase n=1 Tax=Niallia sp. Krafla_26 TaxID=3064703 RepID=UPI003D181F69
MKKQSKSILFLPFLQIPSGHHQVANALIDGILEIDPAIKCHKVDILSFSYGNMEKVISYIYLKWIHSFPNIYNAIYRMSVYKKIETNKRYRLYEILFISFMRKLLIEKRPDLIVCTHALPAYMMNFLKDKIEFHIPVINVYTDYFIHRFWGLDHIDFHFVPSNEVKTFLEKRGINKEKIFVTGIPIHNKIKKINQIPKYDKKSRSTVLISGGNLGIGGLEHLLNMIEERKSREHIQFYVLCGKNKKLYEKLKCLNKNDIIPFPYINCREKMNRLYDEIDAILTKPGGVTISESLFKRKPILIYDALPGQEEINLKQLEEVGLVFHLKTENMYEQILSILQDENKLTEYQNQVDHFHSHIHKKDPAQIITEIII